LSVTCGFPLGRSPDWDVGGGGVSLAVVDFGVGIADVVAAAAATAARSSSLDDTRL